MAKKILRVFGIVVGCLVALVGLVYLASVLMAKPIAQHPFYQTETSDNETTVLAHQGGEGEYPSNTLLAFEKASDAGSNILDGDFHATKDGVLVLAHDETLEPRTNGTGAIRDKTLAELEKLDFAYNWSPDGGKTYPYRGQGITVLTVENLFKAFPDTRFNLEIKQTTTDAALTFCDLIKQHKLEDRVLVTSFRQENMDVFRKACPKVATSATESEVRSFYIFQRLGLVGLYRPKFSSLQVPEKSGNTTLIYNDFIGNAHKRGLPVYAWTIDTPERAQHFIELGVDGINTSYPKRIIEYLKQL